LIFGLRRDIKSSIFWLNGVSFNSHAKIIIFT
jgi:hypothetical protein